MKILFIYPPKNNKALAPSNLEPLALEILAATIPSHDIELLDLRFESFSKLERKLSAFKPDVAGISVNDTIQVYQAKDVLKFIKDIYPQVTNIVGGHHPTLTCEDFYEKYVDAIFLGWAEKSFPVYISFLESKRPINSLPGIILLENGNTIYQNRKIEKLKANDIPRPNRQIAAKYRNHYKNEIGQKFALVNTARGCPHRCTFCACWKAAGGQYLVRDAVDVFDELLDIPRDIERIFFADDNTFSDARRAEELYHLIKSGNIKKKYTGYCRSDIIVKNPEIFARWKEIGLENLTIGFESIDDHKLQQYGKKNRVEINEAAIHILNDLNIRFTSYFLINPDFDQTDFKNLANYVNNNHLIRPRFVVLTPLPGTELYEQNKSRINLNYDFFDFMHWVYPPRLNQIEFFNRLVNLYYQAFSFHRYFKILRNNILVKFKRVNLRARGQKNISLIELILLRIMAFPLRRKLFRQYFQINI